MIDPLKVGVYVLLLLPGFIFMQVHDHHLLREKKQQFEKTLEILLASALIWMLAFSVPRWWPWESSRLWVFREVVSLVGGKAALQSLGPGLTSMRLFAEFFIGVCLWTFVTANLWGYLRKKAWVDLSFKFFTGRGWYPTVALRFFATSIRKAVVVTTEEKRYMGVLLSAPDRGDDGHVVLGNVFLVHEEEGSQQPRLEPLPLIERFLIRLDQVRDIQILKETVLSGSREQAKDNRRSV